MNGMVALLLLAMLASSILCILVRSKPFIAIAMPVCSAVLLTIGAALCIPVLGGETIDDGMFYIDAMSAVFMLLVAFIGLTASVYSRAYIGLEVSEGTVNHREQGQYTRSSSCSYRS